MNRTEQKERLSDVLDMIKDLKEELANKISDVDVAFKKIDDLGDTLYNIVQVDEWDDEELKKNVIKAILEESYMMETRDLLYDFKSDLDSYMSEISENRQEKLEERYAELEEVIEKFEIGEDDDSIESVIERVEEAEDVIKQMKK
ncbi:hypothetical protein [Priestia megaterium]|uniref:hypothetical protein n=1 Tax=Priestia megaterium TaxID=1404 RepID=UPI0028774BBF|nr:hypothetical protein [Priestia megaterium]